MSCWHTVIWYSLQIMIRHKCKPVLDNIQHHPNKSWSWWSSSSRSEDGIVQHTLKDQYTNYRFQQVLCRALCPHHLTSQFIWYVFAYQYDQSCSMQCACLCLALLRCVFIAVKNARWERHIIGKSKKMVGMFLLAFQWGTGIAAGDWWTGLNMNYMAA